MSIYDALQPVFTAVGAVICLIFSLWAIAFISVGFAHLVGSFILERRPKHLKLVEPEHLVRVGGTAQRKPVPFDQLQKSAERSRIPKRTTQPVPFRDRSASSVGRAKW